ncbi:MAG: HNH endonuclease [bacterium]
MKIGDIGKRLNREWKINAEHALYRKTGKEYDNLKRFPGALLDENGFVLFATKQEYEQCPYLHIEKKVYVPNGINKMPNYQRGVARLDEIIRTQENAVAKSLKDPPEKRQKRLATVKGRPVQKEVTITVFLRNPDVIAEVMERSEGICEMCKRQAPFKRRKDGTPYLEVHHLVLLADGGEDTVQNGVAICPNCHREAHFG